MTRPVLTVPRALYRRQHADRFVYRHHDRNGVVIYVGFTRNLNGRQLSHFATTPWRDDIESVSYEIVHGHEAARAREAELIRELRPRHNRQVPVSTAEWSAAPPVETAEERRIAMLPPDMRPPIGYDERRPNTSIVRHYGRGYA